LAISRRSLDVVTLAVDGHVVEGGALAAVEVGGILEIGHVLDRGTSGEQESQGCYTEIYCILHTEGFVGNVCLRRYTNNHE